MRSGRVVVVGGGTAGLSAAYTLNKRGIEAIVLEADDRVGGRMGGDSVGGFSLDQGADFFTASHDVALRLCDELGLRLVLAPMKLGWFRRGRFVTTCPSKTIGGILRNLRALKACGMLSPRAMRTILRLVRTIESNSERLTFSSESHAAEMDGDENVLEYLTRLGAPREMETTMKGFLELNMADLDQMGTAYALTYMSEVMLKPDQLRMPEMGVGSLTHALAENCGDRVSVATPVRHVTIKDGTATGVVADSGTIDADAVICATSATVALDIIPDLPEDVRLALGRVTYSRGCRVVIGLDRPPLPPGLHGVLYPEDATPLLLDRTINLPACAPAGKSTLDLLVGRDRAEELFPLDDEEVRRRLLRDARRNPYPGSNLPGDDDGIFTRVYRWREAVCAAPPGMLTTIAEMRRRNSLQGTNLFLAGDYMRMPSVNGALGSGVDTANEVADWLASRA